MKAAFCTGYGNPDFVQIRDVEKPVPRDGEVLIRVRAASLNPADWHMKRGKPAFMRLFSGLRKPKDPRIGIDVAGVVESVGAGVTRFSPGDEVFGACHGAFAEYACAAESAFCTKPPNITFEQAAAVPVCAFTALQGLRNKAGIKPGHKVLINGAAGGVGAMAIQVAACLGAEVTGVCSAANLDLVRSLGAAHAIDYARQDFARGPERYDIIFDLVANHSIRACLRTLRPSGVYVGAGVLAHKSTAAMFAGMIKSLLYGPLTGGRVKLLIARGNQDDLAFIAELMGTGKVVPVIAKCYPLSAVADAIRHLETKHARGKIVIGMDLS